MIARLLALLAVLALAVSPLNAAAATSTCAHMEDTATAAASPDGAMADMPCCDPDDAAPAMDPACAAACLAMAGVVADLPERFSAGRPAEAWSRYELPPTRILPDHPPSPLERPPRSIA